MVVRAFSGVLHHYRRRRSGSRFDQLRAPENNLTVAASLDNADSIELQVSKLKAAEDRKTVSNGLGWMDTPWQYDGELAYQ